MHFPSRERLRLLGAWAFIIGPVQFVAAMAIEEVLRPGYSPVSDVISDLGVNINGWSYAWIFNTSVIILGSLTLLAAALSYYFLPDGNPSRLGAVFLALAGSGAIAVGIFPKNTHLPHGLAAFIAFVSSAIALLAYSRRFAHTPGWQTWTSPTMILGVFTLASIFAFALGPSSIEGLTERGIVAPILIWAPAVGWRLKTEVSAPKM